MADTATIIDCSQDQGYQGNRAANFTEVRCFVCGGPHFHRLFKKGNKIFFKCKVCSLIVAHPLPTLTELETQYNHNLDRGGGPVLATVREMALATARHRLKILQRYLNRGNLLDVGCSTGPLLEEALKAGFSGEGIELSASAVEEARQRGLNAHQGTVEEFSPNKHYDVVTGFDVIEHVLDPALFLKSVHGLLRDRGIVGLTTPDANSLSCRLMGKYWYFYIPGVHNFIFTRDNLSKLLEQYGFRVLAVLRARKALTYNYGLLVLRSLNPRIHRVCKVVGLAIPSSWRHRPIHFCIGEIMIVAQKVSQLTNSKF